MTRLLHVTDVFRDLYTHAVDPYYLDRGAAVHHARHLLDTAGLDWSTVDGTGGTLDISGFLRAWEACKRKRGWIVKTSEQSVQGPGWKGTLDAVVRISGERHPAIIDVKCGPPEPWHGLQLAAYERGYREPMASSVRPFRRHGVYLKNDGTYDVKEFTGREDYKTFLALLTREYWLISVGLRPWPALREGEAA